MERETLTISTEVEKWRFECPEGHKDWRVWNGVFSCETCKRHRAQGAAVESVYDHLVDTKTGEEVPREQLEIALGAQHQAAATGD